MLKDYDILGKVIIIGDSGVGKSAIMGRHCNNIFEPSFIATIGVDFKYNTVTVNGKNVKLQIWDTAGQERFRVITAAYYRNADIAILTYDVANKRSFDHVPIWINECAKYGKPSLRKILIGNKSDCAERVVTYEQGLKIAQDNGILFAETSAKNGTGVNEAFELITADYLSYSSKNCNKEELKQNKAIPDKVSLKQKPSTKRSCVLL